MPQFCVDKNVQKKMQNSSILLRVLGVFLIASGCGGGPKSPSRALPKVAPVAAPNTSGSLNLGSVESQPTEVLTKSVARVIGFSDVGGRSVTLYQDAYSALYPTLAAKKGLNPAQAPLPLLYYSPLFSLESASSTFDADGNYKIVLKNKHSVERLRPKLAEDLAATFTKLAVDKSRLGQLPVKNITGTVKAFGKAYNATVSPDFAFATVVIAKIDVPAGLFDAQGGIVQKNGKISGIHFLDTMSIAYTYNVQKVKEQSCSLNVDENYIKNLYIKSECPNVFADPVDAEIARIAASKPNWKDLPGLMKQIQSPVTRCLVGTEQQSLLSRASVSCTRSLRDVEGNKTDLSPALAQFAHATWDQPVKDAILTDTPDLWDVNAVAAAVKMFGSPEAYVNEINKFNSKVMNTTSVEETSSALDESNKLLTMIDQLEYHDMKESSSSKSGGGSAILLISFSSNNSESNSSKSVTDIIKNVQVYDKKTRKNELNKQFKANGLKHEIVDVEGKLKFYPHISFAVKADINRIRDASSQLSNLELGSIVQEPEDTTVEFLSRAEANLLGMLECDGVKQSFVQSIQINEWWKSQEFMLNLSKLVTQKIPSSGCATAALKFWYEAELTSGLVPEQLLWNIRPSNTPAAGAAVQHGLSNLTLANTNITQDGAATAPTLSIGSSTNGPVGAPGTVRISKIDISR